MKCPLCKIEMIILELDQVEIDYCTSCEGIWLDEGELELLLEDASAKDQLLGSFTEDAQHPEKRRRCPRCRRRMRKVHAGDQQQVLIDKCTRNHGIWFDKGELHEIFDLGSPDAEHRVSRLLNEMFSYKMKK